MQTKSPTKSLSLLVVDDDVELCEMLKLFFSQSGHRLDCVHNGVEGIATALRGAYDLAILDVMLPSLDGLTLLKEIKHRKALPVIMLTAKAQKRERIAGLDSGADDYIVKPFDPDELLARIYAVLRRTDAVSRNNPTVATVGDLTVRLLDRQVWVREKKVELTELEFDLLELLMRTPGQIVSRESITALLFERETNPYDRFLDVHISHLRKKLECGRSLIRTIRGVGYVFASTL
jgi:DNA-binding response OmpR family regulator